MKKINAYIQEYYQTGEIANIEKKCDKLDAFVKKYIGFSDGLNHVRFMSFLKSYIESDTPKGRWKVPLKERLKAFIYHWYFKCRYFLPKNDYIKRWDYLFDANDIEQAKKVRYPEFDVFYRKNHQRIQGIYKNYANHWMEEHALYDTSTSLSD